MKIKDLFEGFINYQAQVGNCTKTINEYKRFLYGPILVAVGEREIDTLREIDHVLVREAGSHHGIHGPTRAVCYYKALLKYSRRIGFPVSFDLGDIHLPKVPEKPIEYLEVDEIERVLNSFDVNDSQGLRTRALLEFMLGTGLRIGECISLNIEDLDFKKHEIKVLNIKTKEWGEVYMTARCEEWIKRYLDQRKDDLPCLFVSGRGRLLSVTARNYLRTHTKNLGVRKHIKHHIFRKTFGTTLARSKVDLPTVRDLMRHSDERTTTKYYLGVSRERTKAMHQSIMNKAYEDETEVPAVAGMDNGSST